MSTKSLQLGGGRPPKPTAHKALAGTLRADRLNRSEPRATPVALPQPPDDLSELERAAWVELKRVVDPMSIATEADVFAFRQMVEDAGMLAALRRSLIDSGGRPVVVEATKSGGQLRLRPEISAIPTYRRLMLLHFARWGLSPADRQRVASLGEELPTLDPLSKFRLQ